MLSRIIGPKAMVLMFVIVLATNTFTYFVVKDTNSDCSAIKERMDRDEADFKRAMGIPTNLNPNREGGLKITDDIR